MGFNQIRYWRERARKKIDLISFSPLSDRTLTKQDGTNPITMSERHTGSAPPNCTAKKQKQNPPKKRPNLLPQSDAWLLQRACTHLHTEEQTGKQRPMRRFRRCGSSLVEASRAQPSRRSSHFCLSQKHDKRVCRSPSTCCLSREKRKILYSFF